MVCCFFCASRSSVSSTASSSYNRNSLVTPLYCGDPAGIQTQDLQNRNLTLYSAKLQGLRRNALVARTAAMQKLIATTAYINQNIINQCTQ